MVSPHDSSMSALLTKRLNESLEALSELAAHLGTLEAIATRITQCFDHGGTLYLCGNGGSAADAQHIAAEFVGRFLKPAARPGAWRCPS
jgi:D-sedoheptulose 7-phosphate isomerase